MNNKILLTVVGVLVVIGFLLILMNRPSSNSPVRNSQNKVNTPSTVNAPTSPKVIMGDNTITETATAFTPATLPVKAGRNVFWINKSGGTGNVSSAKHPTHLEYSPLNLGDFNNGSSVQLIFDKPGTYHYHDHLHPNRTGTIVVE